MHITNKVIEWCHAWESEAVNQFRETDVARRLSFQWSWSIIYLEAVLSQKRYLEWWVLPKLVHLSIALTLWMLGNFLKIDNIAVCFLKPLNSTCFFIGNDGLSCKQVGSWARHRVTRRLAWIQPVCISINVVPALKGFNSIKPEQSADEMNLEFMVGQKICFWKPVLSLDLCALWI